ncbi:hypothetical protein [Nonomuraea sp. NPDC049129]|uniref:hypothetical protein n=1 Tax=unclassified Nonomuraea TaxID=2593643 RepID=UPI0034019CF6
MRKIRSILAGGAVVGSLAAGLALAPAANAATTGVAATTATATVATSNGFRWYSGFGRGEDRGDRSYIKGEWHRDRSGDVVFVFAIVIVDGDDDYNWVRFKWQDDDGDWHYRWVKAFEGRRYSYRFDRDDYRNLRIGLYGSESRGGDFGGWHKF